MPHRKRPPTSVDAYIAGFPADVRPILRSVRKTIRATAPAAEETISYLMPAYTQNGFPLTSFAAYRKHIGMYGAPVGSPRFNKRLSIYRAAKSTVRFPLDKPIPLDLVAQIVKLRLKDVLKKARERRREEAQAKGR